MEKPADKTELNMDLRERGGPKDGRPQFSERRLYMQFLAYGGCLEPEAEAVRAALGSSELESVLYLDLNDPQGIGLLFMHEDPGFFVKEVRNVLGRAPFVSMQQKPEMTMFGRTYALGREPDLEDWLLHKPRRVAFNHEWPWAVWYPLRRRPEFELLPKEEQSKILFEHAKIGIAYGQQDYAHDIRLACYGLDRNDNEFVIGLMGKHLYPLSKVVQEMRKTQQTAKYIQSLGPFFIGKAYWQESKTKAEGTRP